MRGKFSFLDVDAWFDVIRWKFILKKAQFNTLALFLPISLADTKTISGSNFVALLIK